MRKRLHDSALFWVALGAAVIVLGGVLLSRSPSNASWSNPWFTAGIVVMGSGALLLIWSLVLFLAHRQAEKLMCPDPDAHKTVPAPGPASLWPPQPILLVERDPRDEGRFRAVGTAVPAESPPPLPPSTPTKATEVDADPDEPIDADSTDDLA